MGRRRAAMLRCQDKMQKCRESASRLLENCVDERRDRGAFGKNHESAKNHHHDQHRQKPEFLPDTHKPPKLSHEIHFCPLEHDGIGLNQITISFPCLSVNFSETSSCFSGSCSRTGLSSSQAMVRDAVARSSRIPRPAAV